MKIYNDVARAELRVFLEYMLKAQLGMTDAPTETLDVVENLYGLMGENETIRAYVNCNGDIGFCISRPGDNIDLGAAMEDTLTRLQNDNCEEYTICTTMGLYPMKMVKGDESDFTPVGGNFVLKAPLTSCVDTGITIYPYADWIAFAKQSLAGRSAVEFNTILAVLDVLRHHECPYDYWELIESAFAAANASNVYVDGDDPMPDIIFFTTLE